MMTKQLSLKQWKRRVNLWDIAFLTPQFILYFSLTILPFLIALPIVFTDQVTFIDPDINFIGFQNFINIFKFPLVNEFLPAVTRSIVFTILNYSMVWIFGMSFALLMYEITSRLQRVFFVVIYLPYMISGLGIGMILIMLFSKDTGSINLLLLKMGVIKEAINIVDPQVSRWLLPLFVGWRYAGFNMAIFLSGLLSIPSDTIDAARVDGVNYLQRLKHIYFPQMVPCIIIATIFCLIGSFGIFDEPVGMGAFYGNQSVWFLSIVVYRMGFGISSAISQAGRLSEAMTMCMVVYIPLLLIAISLTRLQKKLQDY